MPGQGHDLRIVGSASLISFIWSPGIRLPAGTGGSENYTVGHVRELNRRGVPAQVVTIGLGTADGREEFDDVPFRHVADLAEVADLDGTVVFVDSPQSVTTRRMAYQVLHVPPPLREAERATTLAGTKDRALIATSTYAAALWAAYLDVDVATIHVVHPFAEPDFARAVRSPRPAGVTRVLFAGRLSPEKGVYTLLSMLHVDIIDSDPGLEVTVTTAGSDKPQGRIIESMLRTHPGLQVVPARKTPAGMAALMAEHDVVVMPSNSQYWHETFGIVSVEAQHAGCRVVASDDGGLPETDCGAVTFVAPDDAEALAWGVHAAALLGSPSPGARRRAGDRFTVAQSVDTLLDVLARPLPVTPARVLQDLEELLLLPPARSGPVVVAPLTLPPAAGAIA